jgi:hypothetical protein
MTGRHQEIAQSFSQYNRYPKLDSNMEHLEYEAGHGFLLVFLSDSLETVK